MMAAKLGLIGQDMAQKRQRGLYKSQIIHLAQPLLQWI